MDDLIYILFLLVWAGFAFYRNSVKKKAAANQQPVPDKPVQRKSAGTILEEILLGEENVKPQEPKPVYRSIDFDTRPKAPFSFEEEYDLYGIESIEEKSPESTRSFSNEKKKVLEEQETGMGEHGIEFDLRTAVVYSEILNRRYF
jgi:hypothetical protein